MVKACPVRSHRSRRMRQSTTPIRPCISTWLLHGLQGAKVGGIAYSSPMPPFGDALSDSDIANIVEYERSSWGNHGTPVTARQVAAERAKGK